MYFCMVLKYLTSATRMSNFFERISIQLPAALWRIKFHDDALGEEELGTQFTALLVQKYKY